MKRLQTLVVTAALLASLAVVGASPARASSDAVPVGDCPNSFHMHQVHGTHGDHEHNHVGNSDDRNGDGYVCAIHVGESGKNHVHIDNNIPSSA